MGRGIEFVPLFLAKFPSDACANATSSNWLYLIVLSSPTVSFDIHRSTPTPFIPCRALISSVRIINMDQTTGS